MLIGTILALALAAQGPVAEPVAQRGRSRTPPPPVVDPVATEVEQLRGALLELTNQVRLLRRDLSDQRAADMRRFGANSTRLQIVQADLDRLKRERAEMRDRLRAAQGRVEDATYRLQNIQIQINLAGDVNRDQAEQRIRDSLTRALEQAQAEAREVEADLFAIERRIEQGEQMAETLRRRLGIDASQIGVDEEPPEPAPAEERDADLPPAGERP